jgi:predicted Zn-dependent protease
LFAFYPDEVALYVLMARLAHRAGRADAEMYRNEALRLAEDDVAAQLEVASGDLLEGRVAPALAFLREIVARDPESRKPRILLAETLLRQGDARGCLTLLALAERDPPPSLYRVRAWCHAFSGATALALDQVTFAALASGSPGEALQEAVRFLSQTVGEGEARRALADLVTRTSDRLKAADAPLAEALLVDLYGRPEEALRILEAAPAEAVAELEVRLRHADLLVRAGQAEAGVTELEGILCEDPNDVLRLNALGFTLADAGLRLAEAEVYLRRAFRLAPDDGYVTDSLGWLLFRRGELAAALRLLVAASRALPGDVEILRHLGDAYRAAGKAEAARAAYQAALDARPAPGLRALIESRLGARSPP